MWRGEQRVFDPLLEEDEPGCGRGRDRVVDSGATARRYRARKGL
jgi:hypothetical protein